MLDEDDGNNNSDGSKTSNATTSTRSIECATGNMRAKTMIEIASKRMRLPEERMSELLARMFEKETLYYPKVRSYEEQAEKLVHWPLLGVRR